MAPASCPRPEAPHLPHRGQTWATHQGTLSWHGLHCTLVSHGHRNQNMLRKRNPQPQLDPSIILMHQFQGLALCWKVFLSTCCSLCAGHGAAKHQQSTFQTFTSGFPLHTSQETGNGMFCLRLSCEKQPHPSCFMGKKRKGMWKE